jgi:hypothetical protein
VPAAKRKSDSIYNGRIPGFKAPGHPLRLTKNKHHTILDSPPLQAFRDFAGVQNANKNRRFRPFFINSISIFIRTITGSITALITSVALHEVLHKFVCT